VKRWILIGGAVVVLGAIVVVNLKKNDTPSVSAKLGAVERRNLTSSISAPGRIRAVSSVDISAEVPGRVVELAVAEGDSVRAGDLLLRLDDAQYRSRVEQAGAAVKSARAGLVLSEARLRQLDKDRARLAAMAEKNLASAEALEKVQTEYEVQQADVDARRQETARMEAALADARDNLDKTVYRAPANGIVSRLNVEQGEIVITGTMNNPGTVILTIADLSFMEVEAEVDETDVVNVRPGQPAKITVDAIPDTTFAGRVATVGNSGRQATGASTEEVVNFEVKVRFDSPDPRLKPGMTADVEVETETREQVMAVPIQAVVARSRGVLEKDEKAALRKHRKKKDEGGSRHAAPDTLKGPARDKWEKEVLEGLFQLVNDKARFVEVKTGIADETMIEITGAAAESMKVVTGPYRVLRDLKEGVRIKEAKEDKGGKGGKSGDKQDER
jgi:HlyD family secretion protein